MDAIISLLLWTGMQWKALDATGICSYESAYRRFREWIEAGVFAAFWTPGLFECEQLRRINWDWLPLDRTMTKAPLGGEKNGAQPYRPRQKRRQTQFADERCGLTPGRRGRASEPARRDAGR